MADPLAPVPSLEKKSQPGPGTNEVAYWLGQIDAAADREEKWLKEANETVELFEGQNVQENSFNVLYSNVETLLPAIYSNLPRPEVTRRYDDDDPRGKAVAEACRRGLEYALDSPDPQYTPFHDLFKMAVLGALVPGRAVTRFKYDPEFIQQGQETDKEPEVTAGSNDPPEEQTDETESSEVVPDEQTEAAPPPVAPAPTGAPAASPPDVVKYEVCCGTNWPHDRFLHGYARRWSDVPWIAYEHRMTKADVQHNFGRTWAEKLKYAVAEKKEGEKEKDQKGAPKTAQVYEIWHKSKKRVIFVSPCWKDSIIGKRLDDPLELPGFFDCPPPLMFVNRNTNLVPVVPYALYREQAKELNRVSMRINKIISALKVRGFYNGQIKELENLMAMPENQIIPAQNVAMLAESGGLERHIWLMPLDKLVAVLQQLYLQRQQVKQVIYEITGISDILRGATVASETATAQNIKNQWGTLRLKDMQSRAATYIRDCLRIVAAIQGKHFSLETWQKMTELPFPTKEEKAKAQQMAQAIQQQAMQAIQQLPPQPPPQGPPPGPPQGPPQGPPGQPPQPNPNDPAAKIQQQAQQGMQKLQPILSSPFTWEDILQVLGENLSRGYNIDVETNSTVVVDATEDKQAITDLFGAMAQVLQAMMPMVEAGVMPPGVVKSMLLTTSRRFRFGNEVEDSLKGMQEQMPPKQDPAMAKAQAESQMMQQEAGIKQQQANQEQQSAQLDFQLKQKDMQNKMALMDKELEVKQKELDLKERELQMKEVELGQKQQMNQITHDGKMQVAAATRDAKLMSIATAAAMPKPAPNGGVQ